MAAKEIPFSIECNVISVQRWVLPGLKRLLGNDGEHCHASPGALARMEDDRVHWHRWRHLMPRKTIMRCSERGDSSSSGRRPKQQLDPVGATECGDRSPC